MDKAYAEIQVKEGIGTIEFYHPNHNALPGILLKRIVELLNQASDDPLVKLVLLKSGGDRTFCAGADFDELRKIGNEKEGKAFFSGFATLINAIRENKKIVVARIHGKAVGGGVGIAAAADITFASKFASVKLSELAIGIGPFVIAPAVERKIGLSNFSKMTLQPNNWFTASMAESWGLFARVFDDVDELDKHLLDYFSSLSNFNPEALLALKQILWKDTAHWPELLDERAAMSGKLVLSDFTKKAINKIKI